MSTAAAYAKRFCEIESPADIVEFLEMFVYLWPCGIALLFGLYYLGANVLPCSLLVAVPGVLASEALWLQSSTISPYSTTDYHLLNTLKTIGLVIGAVVVGLPCAVILHDYADFLILSLTPSFLVGQALSAKLGVCVGTLVYMLREYIRDASNPLDRGYLRPGAVPVLALPQPAPGASGLKARARHLYAKAKAVAAHYDQLLATLVTRRKGGAHARPFYHTFLVTDVGPIVVMAFVAARCLGTVHTQWLLSARVFPDGTPLVQ